MDLVKRLATLSSLPWLCFGDFNEILVPFENLGGNDRDVRMMFDFRDTIRECELMDLGWKGQAFTWSNRRYGPHFIEERLDQFLYNRIWSNMFHETAAETLALLTSYHNSIIMNIKEKGRGIRFYKKTSSQIHYKDMWSLYEKSKEIVKREWPDHNNRYEDNIVQNFRKTAKKSLALLKIWSRNELEDRKMLGLCAL